MSIKLFNGLINLGGILTETYYRKTRATSDAKTELGLDPAKDYNSSIGIASISEYVALTKTNLVNNTLVSQNLAPFDQAFEIVNVQSSNMDADQFYLTVYASNGTVLFRRLVNKNLSFYPISGVYVPVGAKIDLVANGTVSSITVLLKPCVIIADTIPVVTTPAP